MLNFILGILQSYMKHIVSFMITYLLTLSANLSYKQTLFLEIYSYNSINIKYCTEEEVLVPLLELFSFHSLS